MAILAFFSLGLNSADAQAISKDEFDTIQAAMTLSREGKHQDAIKRVQALLDDSRTGQYARANALNSKGFFQYQLEDYAGAIESYKSILRMDELDHDMRVQTTYTIAQLATVTEDYREALRQVNAHMEIVDDAAPGTYVLRAQILYQLGRFEQMIEPLNTAVQKAHESGESDKEDWWTLLAFAYLETKDVENLDRVYQTLKERWPAEKQATHAVGAYIKIPDRQRTVKAIEYLLENYPDTDYMSPLHLAVAAGNEAAVREELASGAAINSEMGSSRPPLHLAAGFGDREMVSVLLELGADINYVTEQGSHVAHTSSNQLDADLTRYLWEHGANLGVDENGESIAFVNLAASGDTQLIADLAAVYPDLVSKQGNSALSVAVAGDDEIMVNLLLELGAPTDAEAEVLPLRHAAARGHLALAALLLDAGANINAIDESGNSPIMSAVRAEHSDMALMLIERGADVTPPFPNGNCVLSESAYNGDKAVFTAALAAGAPPHGASQDGRPLRFALYADDLDGMQALIDAGAPVDWSSDDIQNILVLAVAEKSAEATRLLLANGAPIEKPLGNLLGWSQRDVTRFLKKHGYRRTQRGDTEVWSSEDQSMSVSVPKQKEAYSMPEIVDFMSQTDIDLRQWLWEYPKP